MAGTAISWEPAYSMNPSLVSPADSSAYDEAHKHANAIHAVPQPEEVRVEVANSVFALFKRYRYPPLASKSIRLLRIQGRDEGSVPVRGSLMPLCEIIHIDLDNCPQYEAISYAWGDLTGSTPIFIGDRQMIFVTEAVSQIIWRLRPPSGFRDIWIDQLCINQHDLAERSQQVRGM